MMGIEEILRFASISMGFIAVTIMLVRFFLIFNKKITFKTNIKLIEIIIGVCIVKVVLAICVFTVFGIIAWTINTFIWVMISEMEKNNEENKKRINNGDSPILLTIKEALTNVFNKKK